MVCPSFVLGGDANTGSAGYVCLETELIGWESDFHAAMLAAFAFAALLGLPSFFAVVCPGAATLFLGGVNDFYAAMLAAFAFAALMAGPRASQWIAQLYMLRFQVGMRTLAKLVMFASWRSGSLISLPRCLLRTPLLR